MTNATYTLKNPGSDRIIFNDGGTIINFRVRPGETVEVDLADSDQDAAFDESKYNATGSGFQHKVKPSA